MDILCPHEDSSVMIWRVINEFFIHIFFFLSCLSRTPSSWVLMNLFLFFFSFSILTHNHFSSLQGKPLFEEQLVVIKFYHRKCSKLRLSEYIFPALHLFWEVFLLWSRGTPLNSLTLPTQYPERHVWHLWIHSLWHMQYKRLTFDTSELTHSDPCSSQGLTWHLWIHSH